MELSVANATAAFEMVLSPGAGIASAAGKKETKGFLMQGASPLAFPGLGGARHGLNLRSRHPAGGYPRRWRLDQPLRCPAGACSAGCLLTLPLVYFVSPIPPPPPSRGGWGRPWLFHARGCAPCIPGTGWDAARAEPAEQAPGGGVPPALAARPAVAVPDGGLPCWSPADPAISLLCFPLSPCPLPRRGRGRL